MKRTKNIRKSYFGCEIEEDGAVPAEKNFSWKKLNDVPQIQADDNLKHAGFQCNLCTNDIIGFRYTCVHCSDFDMCGACEANILHPQHYMLRVPGPRPLAEVQFVLTTIRRNLLQRLNSITKLENWDTISIKTEVLTECGDVDDFADNICGEKCTSHDNAYNDTTENRNSVETSAKKPNPRQSCSGERLFSIDKLTDGNNKEREIAILSTDAPEMNVTESAPKTHGKRKHSTGDIPVSCAIKNIMDIEVEKQEKTPAIHPKGVLVSDSDSHSERTHSVEDQLVPDEENKILQERIANRRKDSLEKDIDNHRETIHSIKNKPASNKRSKIMNKVLEVQESEVAVHAKEVSEMDSERSQSKTDKSVANKSDKIWNTILDSQLSQIAIQIKDELENDSGSESEQTYSIGDMVTNNKRQKSIRTEGAEEQIAKYLKIILEKNIKRHRDHNTDKLITNKMRKITEPKVETQGRVIAKDAVERVKDCRVVIRPLSTGEILSKTNIPTEKHMREARDRNSIFVPFKHILSSEVRQRDKLAINKKMTMNTRVDLLETENECLILNQPFSRHELMTDNSTGEKEIAIHMRERDSKFRSVQQKDKTPTERSNILNTLVDLQERESECLTMDQTLSTHKLLSEMSSGRREIVMHTGDTRERDSKCRPLKQKDKMSTEKINLLNTRVDLQDKNSECLTKNHALSMHKVMTDNSTSEKEMAISTIAVQKRLDNCSIVSQQETPSECHMMDHDLSIIYKIMTENSIGEKENAMETIDVLDKYDESNVDCDTTSTKNIVPKRKEVIDLTQDQTEEILRRDARERDGESTIGHNMSSTEKIVIKRQYVIDLTHDQIHTPQEEQLGKKLKMMMSNIKRRKSLYVESKNDNLTMVPLAAETEKVESKHDDNLIKGLLDNETIKAGSKNDDNLTMRPLATETVKVGPKNVDKLTRVPVATETVKAGSKNLDNLTMRPLPTETVKTGPKNVEKLPRVPVPTDTVNTGSKNLDNLTMRSLATETIKAGPKNVDKLTRVLVPTDTLNTGSKNLDNLTKGPLAAETVKAGLKFVDNLTMRPLANVIVKAGPKNADNLTMRPLATETVNAGLKFFDNLTIRPLATEIVKAGPKNDDNLTMRPLATEIVKAGPKNDDNLTMRPLATETVKAGLFVENITMGSLANETVKAEPKNIDNLTMGPLATETLQVGIFVDNITTGSLANKNVKDGLKIADVRRHPISNLEPRDKVPKRETRRRHQAVSFVRAGHASRKFYLSPKMRGNNSLHR